MKKILSSLSLALITFACEKPDNVISDVPDTYETVATLRTITSSGEYNYNAPEASVFSITIEEYDEENGALMENVEVYVSLNGGDEALVKTIASSTFIVGPTGSPRTDLTVSLAEAVAALGLSRTDYTGGDSIKIRLQLNLIDGRSFSSESVTGSMTGSYFKSPFEFSKVIKCIPLGVVPGVYTITMTDTYGDGWNNAYILVTVDGVETAIGIPTRWAGYEEVNNLVLPNIDAGYTFVSATATITIPEGASTMSFVWSAGDWDSEVIYSIDFETLAGTDVQTAITESNPRAGEKVLNICL